MATENEKYSFIETLNKFRNGEVIEISDILKKRDAIDMKIILDTILFQINILKTKGYDKVKYEVEKESIKFFYGLLQCTSLEIQKEDIDIVNYDIDFEDFILEHSVFAKKMYFMIDNIIRKNDIEIVSMLEDSLKNIPKLEEIKETQKEMDKMFQNKKDGELKFIEDILAYNDPSMKAIKDIISVPIENKALKGLDKNGDNITKR